MLHVEWADGEKAPSVEVVSNIATRDRATDLVHPNKTIQLSSEERKLYLAGTDLIPVDGIVKQTANQITAGVRTDVQKAQDLRMGRRKHVPQRSNSRLRHRRHRGDAEVR